MDNEAVLRKIKEICNSKEWSMYRLSRESGIPQSTLSSLFARRANVSLSKLDRICSAFGMKMSDFFALLESEEEKKSGWAEHEVVQMLKEAEGLSSNNKRLLRAMITVMEELEREIETEKD